VTTNERKSSNSIAVLKRYAVTYQELVRRNHRFITICK